MKTVLILSCGTRNKIVQYFKREMRVLCADASPLAPALYEGDKHFTVPRLNEAGYLDAVLEICKSERPDAVLSLIDPELSVLAQNEDKFCALGVKIIGSPYDACERAFDKFAFYRFLCENGFNCAKTYAELDSFKADFDAGKISFPVFVKPVCGSASIAISKASSMEELALLCSLSSGLIIQEFLDGQELGVDCYVDLISKKTVSLFAKKKLVMRAGETDKAVSFKDGRLFSLCERLMSLGGFLGQVDVDVFDIDGEYYISEVNPRFGGGYPHAYECGVNHISLIARNLEGQENIPSVGEYEENIYMAKYNEVMIIK